MDIKLNEVTGLVEELAPGELATQWDNAGLQIGDYNKNVEKVLIALDINRKVLEEAVSIDTDLIITHHPLFLSGIKSIRYDTAGGWIIKNAVKEDISIYSAHTNYDIAKGGLNDLLAEKLGVKNTRVLKNTGKNKLRKIVVFVPEDALDKVRMALGEAGAGWIGNYSHCSFFARGTGSFKPQQGTSPHTGSIGEINTVKEYRLETVVYEKDINKTIKKMSDAHPYEEVAYDIYPLENQGEIYGIGRIGSLEEKTTLKKYAEKIKKVLDISNLKISGDPGGEIKKVALCAGSGRDLIESAASRGADLFISGDITYHAGQAAEEKGMNLIDAGHHGSEKIMISGMADYLRKKIKERNLKVEIIESEINTDPFWKL